MTKPHNQILIDLPISAPYSNPTTSRAAARSIEIVAGTDRHAILCYLRDQGSRGATCDQIEGALEYRHQSASARLLELRQLGFVKDSGETRKTQSGRQAIVWVAS